MCVYKLIFDNRKESALHPLSSLSGEGFRLIKGGLAILTGGIPLDKSGGPLSPGGDCFAPFYSSVRIDWNIKTNLECGPTHWYTPSSLVQFYLYQMDLLTTYRYAQMCSRSTPVGPNCRRQLKVLVLLTEINFEAFLEAISESGRR